MKLSLIIVSWKVKDLLAKCLLSIQQNPPPFPYEVIVVDNNSQDGTVEMVHKEFPQVILIASPDNNGFAKGNNLGIERITADTEYIMLLNPDTEVKGQALAKLVQFMDQHQDAGASGPKLLNPDGSLQPSCKTFPTISSLIYNSLLLDSLFPRSKLFGSYEMSWWAHNDLMEVDQPMGAALMVRKNIIDQIGLMDEQFYMFFD
ncbi:MAG: glycosyltransferase family 2 protein, partial [Candidatus Margulisiibacteriota bacterium]